MEVIFWVTEKKINIGSQKARLKKTSENTVTIPEKPDINQNLI